MGRLPLRYDRPLTLAEAKGLREGVAAFSLSPPPPVVRLMGDPYHVGIAAMLYTDCCVIPDPQKARSVTGIGAVVYSPEAVVVFKNGYERSATEKARPQEWEWEALVWGLQQTLACGYRRVLAYTDSDWLLRALASGQLSLGRVPFEFEMLRVYKTSREQNPAHAACRDVTAKTRHALYEQRHPATRPFYSAVDSTTDVAVASWRVEQSHVGIG